jgi:hypothetical protein
MRSRRWLVLFALSVAACGYRPARYADQPPVTEVSDDRPIAMPRRTPFIEAFYLSDVYLRRPIVDALDAERFPNARDVNALDEVPRSSWYDPPSLRRKAFDASVSRGPEAPVVYRPGSGLLTDRRGESFLLASDDGPPETRTAAELIASRLVRALGYRTPTVTLIDPEELGLEAELDPTRRWIARRWPLGVDLGPTDMTLPRSDDPNDRVSHRDRRTLRALGVVAAWLDLREIGPSHLRDVYVGRPGRGHVQHLLVDLGDALGSPRTRGSHRSATAVGVVRGSPLENLVTLGLARPPANGGIREPTLRVFSATGAGSHALVDPWEPVDRLLPADGYWIAKRMARIGRGVLEDAVRAAHFEDPALDAHVLHALIARRRDLVAHWFREVTPCELERLLGRDLVLADEAVRAGIDTAGTRHYEVAVLDDSGAEVTPKLDVRSRGEEIRFELPEIERDYLVVRVTKVGSAGPAPRPFEVHLVQERGAPRVVGARH